MQLARGKSIKNTRERGAVFTEFAIAAPVFLAFIYIIIDWALMIQELTKVHIALDKAERAVTEASSSIIKTDYDALISAGTAYRDELKRLGVKLKRVDINSPTVAGEYALMSGSEIKISDYSAVNFSYSLPRTFQINVQYHPQCVICKMLGSGLQLKRGGYGITFNLTSVVMIEDESTGAVDATTGIPSPQALTHYSYCPNVITVKQDSYGNIAACQ